MTETKQKSIRQAFYFSLSAKRVLEYRSDLILLRLRRWKKRTETENGFFVSITLIQLFLFGFETKNHTKLTKLTRKVYLRQMRKSVSCQTMNDSKSSHFELLPWEINTTRDETKCLHEFSFFRKWNFWNEHKNNKKQKTKRYETNEFCVHFKIDCIFACTETCSWLLFTTFSFCRRFCSFVLAFTFPD